MGATGSATPRNSSMPARSAMATARHVSVATANPTAARFSTSAASAAATAPRAWVAMASPIAARSRTCAGPAGVTVGCDGVAFSGVREDACGVVTRCHDSLSACDSVGPESGTERRAGRRGLGGMIHTRVAQVT
eukprot:763112-Hanusia_phi.AAC.4